MVAAIFHILGTILALAVFVMVTGLRDGYKSRKKLEGVLEVAAVKLGLPKDGVVDVQNKNRLAEYLAERYNTDSLANRLSDLWRTALVAVEVLSYLCQIGVVIMISWLAFTNDLTYAKSAWLALAVAVFFWVFIILAAGLCYLATGRSPGEAQDSRKLASGLLENE